MSTRGCVAIKTEEGWRGVYNHWDSYPTGLGKELWDYLHEVKRDDRAYRCLKCGKEFTGNLMVPVYFNQQIVVLKCPYCRGRAGRDLNEFAERLLQFGDWREYLNDGVCEYCGKRIGQPCSISGVLFGIHSTAEEVTEYWQRMAWAKDKPEEIKQGIEREIAILRNIERTAYPDPEAKYHSHIGKEAQIGSDNPDPLFVEWVYVIDPEERTITVLAHQSDKKTEGKVREEPIKRDDGFWDYGHCAYQHIEVAKIDLDGAEPDWELLEAKSRA